MPGGVNGIGPRDADLILRDGATLGNLVGDETVTGTLPAGVSVTSPLAVVVLVPQTSASDTLKVTAKITTSGKKIEVTHTDDIDGNTTFPFVLRLPLPPVKGGTALSVVLDTTGSGINYGEVDVWVERGGLAKVDA
jgi:hypothetical protein